MTNKQRRSIVDEAKSKGYEGSYVDLFKQAALNPTQNKDVLIADTPLEKEQGLRPLHEAGRTDASMAFKDVPPNTPFNTVGMKAPIDIKKYDEQGHLVKSYEDVPPGLTNIDSGPARGTVLETPSRMQYGGYNPGEYMNEMQPKVFPNQKRDAKWVNYATQHDFAGRFPGETRTNREIGLERSNRNTVPLVPNPVRPKELGRRKAQLGLGPSMAGSVVFNESKRRIAENISPFGYDNPDEDAAGRLKSAVIENKPEADSTAGKKGKERAPFMKERTDMLNILLGRNQEYGSVPESQYKPTKGSMFGSGTYYSSPTTESWIQRQIDARGADRFIKAIDNKRDPETGSASHYWHTKQSDNVLGNYILDVGEDEKGKYISYYDTWDLNPISKGKPGLAKTAENAVQYMLGIRPPEVYGRVYIKKKGGYKSAR